MALREVLVTETHDYLLTENGYILVTEAAEAPMTCTDTEFFGVGSG